MLHTYNSKRWKFPEIEILELKMVLSKLNIDEAKLVANKYIHIFFFK